MSLADGGYKKGPFTLRASAVLPAAGAFDAVNLIIACERATFAEVFFDFTRGSGTSAFQWKLETFNDVGATKSAYDRALVDIHAPTTSSDTLTAPMGSMIIKAPVPATGSLKRFSVPLDIHGAAQIALVAAEYGDTANPGTLAATIVLYELPAP